MNVHEIILDLMNILIFDLYCDMCLHCVHHCPTQSIQIGDFTKEHVRYKKVDLI